MAVVAGHKIKWFVVVDGVELPREAGMIGTWGYEAKCSCGWVTRTGGATKSYISGEVRFHKLYES